MDIYLLLLGITLVSLLLHKHTRCKTFAVLPYVMMALVAGVRSEVGVDYLSYKTQFYDIVDHVGWSLNFEPGFRFVVKCIDALGFSYQVLFLLASCFTCFFYYKFIKDNSNSFELSTIMFMCLGPFYLSSYNAVRQALAISIFLYAIKYLEKDIKKYYVCLLVAATIHISAIVFLLIPFIVKAIIPFLKKTRKAYLLNLLIGFCLFYALIRLQIIDRIIATYFSSRIKMTDYSAKMDNSYIAFMGVCLIIIVINSIRKLEIKPIFIYMLIFTFILIGVAFLSPQYGMFLTRFVSWGTPALIIALPELRVIIKPQILYKGVVYCGCIGYYIVLINSTSAKLIPYAYNLHFLK